MASFLSFKTKVIIIIVNRYRRILSVAALGGFSRLIRLPLRF